MLTLLLKDYFKWFNLCQIVTIEQKFLILRNYEYLILIYVLLSYLNRILFISIFYFEKIQKMIVR